MTRSLGQRNIMDVVNDHAAQAGWEDARNREAVARHYVYESLPRPLKRLVDHPKALRLYYRLRPSKRPTMVEQRHPDGSRTMRFLP